MLQSTEIAFILPHANKAAVHPLQYAVLQGGGRCMCPNKCGSQKGWCENSAGHYTAPNHARCRRMAHAKRMRKQAHTGRQKPTPLKSLLLVHQASCKTYCRNMAEHVHGQTLDQRLRCHVLNTCGFPKTASPGKTARQHHAGCSALCAARRLSIHSIIVLRISSLPGSLTMTCQRFGMMCSALSVEAARS